MQLYLAFSPNTPAADSAVQAMRDSIIDVRNGMINDRLLLNDDKTEFLLLGTRQQVAKVNITNITVVNTVVTSETAVKNLGAWFDSTPEMSTHVSKICSGAFYHLHNIRRIRKFMGLEDTKTLDPAFLTSRVDYSNSLLYGIPAYARLDCRAQRYCRIIPLTSELHWLPIRQRIHFKMLLFTFKAIHGIAPLYIQGLVQVRSQGAYSLRSSRAVLLDVPSIRAKVTLGDRAFEVAALKLWNSLPSELRLINNMDILKRHLKTYLFKVALD